MNIELCNVKKPSFTKELKPVLLSDETMAERKAKVLYAMERAKLDALVIYGDLEHGSNLEYLIGFLPRFEEALLVLHKNGKAYLLLGNENLGKAVHARIQAEAIHVPHFSLPNQPMKDDADFCSYLSAAGLRKGMRTGIVGWKMFTSAYCDNRTLFDLPYYIIQALQDTVGKEQISNVCTLFIGENGVRRRNNANELAHYAFGSALASTCMLDAMDHIREGSTEMEIADRLHRYGQRHSVVTIMATGERFEKANLYPGSKQIKAGDKLSLTVGYKGGLSSRAGYAVRHTEELPAGVKDYLEVLAKPYFAAVAEWLETIRIGMKGEELYQHIERILPKKDYGWTLNPGHLIADEEWMSSPVYEGSQEVLQSGMMLQIDIIPSKSGYGGTSCESGIALADEHLRDALRKEYPALYAAMMKRREYMEEALGIHMHPEVLPMNDTVAYYRPYMLDHEAVLVKR